MRQDRKDNTSESKILIDLSLGSSKAFEWLFMRYYSKTVEFINSFLCDHDLSRDVAQDIFYTIWKDRKKFKNVVSFQAYIFKMAKCYLYNYFDHQNVITKYEAEQKYKGNDYVYSDENTHLKDTQSIIMNVINRQPEKRKKIFLLSRISGLSNEEIAKKMSISKRTVENHISTVLRELKTVVINFLLFVFLQFYL